MRTILILLLIIITTACEGTKNISPVGTPQPSPAATKAENMALGTYSTKLLDKKRPRLKNIDKAIEQINKATIMPGETFSFNETVGPRTAERGFEKALTIIRKQKVLDYGGGVCQISTTIYNAALGAGLEIVERHQHEKEVGYVKLGDDATVSFGSLDLKIKNNKSVPIKLRVTVGKNTIDAVVVTAM